MKVCLIVEGTYPYVTGGVSSWIQTLISNLPDIEFKIVHLSPTTEKRKILYKIPENISEIIEIPIFSEIDWDLPEFEDYSKITYDIFSLIDLEWEVKVKSFIDILKRLHGKNIIPLFKSNYYWKMILDIYQRHFKNEGFTRYFWTVRNFLLPMINSFQYIPPKCDIYHSVTTGYAALTALSGKYAHNGKLIITEHGIYHREREREILTADYIPSAYKSAWIGIFKLISAVAYKESDALTTLFSANQIFQIELGASYEKMEVIPNGIDVKKFSLKKLPHKNFIIGFVGRITPIKDVKTALKAVKLLYEEIKDIRFVLVGPYEEDPEYFQECLELTKSLEIENIVKFVGRQDVRKFYKIFDVLLLSSVSEGQPLVILEAMAAGIPVIATNVGACSEMIISELGNAGFIVSPKDYVSIAQNIKKLYLDKELSEKMAEVGRKLVNKKYRLDQMISAYRNLYEKVLSFNAVVQQ